MRGRHWIKRCRLRTPACEKRVGFSHCRGWDGEVGARSRQVGDMQSVLFALLSKVRHCPNNLLMLSGKRNASGVSLMQDFGGVEVVRFTHT